MIDMDLYFMRIALLQAREAASKDEVPVGALIVQDHQILAKAHNLRETLQDPTAHAEILALTQAASALGTWRLSDATIYVTLEPCPMCAGALVQSRIKRLVYSAPDPKGGAVKTLYNLVQDERFNHWVEVTSGVMEEESSHILKEFFTIKRIGKAKK